MWEQVIDVPEVFLFLSKMPVYPYFQTIQSAPGVNIIAFWKIVFPLFPNPNAGLFVQIE